MSRRAFYRRYLESTRALLVRDARDRLGQRRAEAGRSSSDLVRWQLDRGEYDELQENPVNPAAEVAALLSIQSTTRALVIEGTARERRAFARDVAKVLAGNGDEKDAPLPRQADRPIPLWCPFSNDDPIATMHAAMGDAAVGDRMLKWHLAEGHFVVITLDMDLGVLRATASSASLPARLVATTAAHEAAEELASVWDLVCSPQRPRPAGEGSSSIGVLPAEAAAE